MTQDDAHRGAPDPTPSTGGEAPRQPAHPPLPSYGAHGSTGAGATAGHGAPGQPGYGAPPGYGSQPGYGVPPPYGQPAYGPPPGYGVPGYGPPPGYGYPRPTNTLAILSLVMAFVFSPVGLVLGIVARRQIRQTGEQGDGLALAGIIIGGIATALAVLAFLFLFLALASVGSVDFAP
ncbi:DUF4190 domain-containing protein [Geodermatophilus sp. URMC 61]|uniref:DUF4190 domain-containing protein n=1 Tax=Geodermatophilus sp. URMC 61 TaxID=3423411 RepID=UPI00406C4E4C